MVLIPSSLAGSLNGTDNPDSKEEDSSPLEKDTFETTLSQTFEGGGTHDQLDPTTMDIPEALANTLKQSNCVNVWQMLQS